MPDYNGPRLGERNAFQQYATTDVVANSNTYGTHGYSDSLIPPDRLRGFFGSPPHDADPMITGYGFAFFVHFPKAIQTNMMLKRDILTGVCVSATIPSFKQEVVEYEGRDGGKWKQQTTLI